MHSAFRMMNAPIKNSIHLRFEKWLVADMTSGVATANVIAKADTSVPACELVSPRLDEISVRIPTMTNSLVPRTNVKSESVKISSQCRLVNSVVFIVTFLLCSINNLIMITQMRLKNGIKRLVMIG